MLGAARVPSYGTSSVDRKGEEGGGPPHPVSPGPVSLGAIAAGLKVPHAKELGRSDLEGGVGRFADPKGAPGSERGSADEDATLRPDLLPVNDSRPSLASRTGLFAGAGLCFSVGLLLWPVPVATGLPFHVGGLLLLGMASRRVARALNRWERRLPERFSRPLRRVVASVRARFHRQAPLESEGEGAP